MSNKLTVLAREILAVEEDLPFRFDYERDRQVRVDDFEIIIFPQTWGSTALGFGGMGGQAITTADTIVCIPECVDQPCFVYFAGRFAYAVEWSERFAKDVARHGMLPVSRAGAYQRAHKEEKGE